MAFDFSILGTGTLRSYSKEERAKWAIQNSTPQYVKDSIMEVERLLYTAADHLHVAKFKIGDVQIDYTTYSVRIDFECALNKTMAMNMHKYLNSLRRDGTQAFMWLKHAHYEDDFADAYLFEMHYLPKRSYWGSFSELNLVNDGNNLVR